MENNQKDLKVSHQIISVRTISKIESEIFKGLFRAFGRFLYNLLNSIFKKETNLKLEELTKMKYGEFIDSLNPPIFCTILDLKNINSQGLFIITSPLNKIISDKLIGGPGSLEGLNLEELTEIEINILRNFSQNLIDNFASIFKPLIGENVEITRVETIPILIRILEENDEILIAKTKIMIENEEKGEFLLCFPYLSIKTNIEILQKEIYKTYYTEKDKENLIKILLETPLNLVFSFKEIKYPLQKMKKIKEGDTIVLPIDIEEPLICEVEEIPWFFCKMGKIKNKIAFKILREVKNE
jgi:flagellar motor switch protein FliM